MDLKEQRDKLEGLVNFLEEEKTRLQDKVEKTAAAGEQQFGVTQRRCVTLLHFLLGVLSQTKTWCWSWRPCVQNMAFAEGSAPRLASMHLSRV